MTQGKDTAIAKVPRGSARRFVGRAVVGLSLILLAFAGIAWFLFAKGSVVFGLADTELRLAAIILSSAGFVVLFGLTAISGPRREWERILELILGQRRMFMLMLAGSFVLVLTELSLPLILKYIIDEVVNRKGDASLLNIFLGVLLGILIMRLGSGYLRTLNAQGLGYRIAAALRGRLYAHLQRLSYSFFDRARQGELMSKITNDVVTLQNFIINSSEDFFVAPLKVIGAVALIFYLNWQLALIVLGTALLTALLLKLTGGRLRSVNRVVQERMGDLTAQLAEGINTIRLAQSFGLERRDYAAFERSNKGALDKTLTHVQISAVLLPTIEFLGFTAPLVIIAVMCYKAIGQGALLDAGELLAISGYGALVANPLGKLSRLLVTLAMGEAASSRIHGVLETKPEITDRDNAADIDSVEGHITFSSVSLRYEKNKPQVLIDIELDIKPGEVVAFVGESGSGKSSLLHLVPRFYEVSEGSVMVDGRDVRDIRLGSLRRHIGIVSQDTILVHGTIRENIAYGTPGADEKDIIDAAMSANAHNFVMEFPDGYDTMVGERGVTLSGGQRQRVAIARALLRDPALLLLDEATSALDSVSEAVVQDALNKLMYGRTTLMVAHRLSTVRNADRIAVLKNGRIIEEGNHGQLMEMQGEYARLVKLQGMGS